MLLHCVGRKHGTLRAARKPNRHERKHKSVGKTVDKTASRRASTTAAAVKHAVREHHEQAHGKRNEAHHAKAENTPEMADSTKNGATMPIR